MNSINVADKLIENTVKTKNPSVIGLDPDLAKIPGCYKNDVMTGDDPFKAVANVIFNFNKDIINTVCGLVPAVKPQMAFYEKYGSRGVRAFEKTVAYAKEKGLIVIEDAKRNDIGNTAKAYAEGHLGSAEVSDGSKMPSFDVDFLTVTPFLGSESLEPFINVCAGHGKGIFILVKTSNSSSGEIQDIITPKGTTVSRELAKYVAMQGESSVGKHGYSSIGAVVGATYPQEAVELRKIMKHSYFLVPGYGTQGGSAKDIIPCFNSDGLGAVVNSSRGILYSHMTDDERNTCSKEEYLSKVYKATKKMQEDIYTTLKDAFPDMIY